MGIARRCQRGSVTIDAERAWREASAAVRGHVDRRPAGSVLLPPGTR